MCGQILSPSYCHNCAVIALENCSWVTSAQPHSHHTSNNNPLIFQHTCSQARLWVVKEPWIIINKYVKSWYWFSVDQKVFELSYINSHITQHTHGPSPHFCSLYCGEAQQASDGDRRHFQQMTDNCSILITHQRTPHWAVTGLLLVFNRKHMAFVLSNLACIIDH